VHQKQLSDIKDLQSGRVTLLIDGLDEVSSQEERQKLITTLLDFSSKYSRCQIILSSRNYLWLSELQGIEYFEPFRISPINWQQTRQIRRYRE
jgi:predicted NACHT family NTPase